MKKFKVIIREGKDWPSLELVEELTFEHERGARDVFSNMVSSSLNCCNAIQITLQKGESLPILAQFKIVKPF